MSDTSASAVPDETWGPADPHWEEYYSKRVPYDGPIPSTHTVSPLSVSFGRSLDTLEKARLWLTNPHNWHESKLFILKWDGLLCSVNKQHGERLVREPWDSGLPWCAVNGQRRRRDRGDRGEALEDPSETVSTSED